MVRIRIGGGVEADGEGDCMDGDGGAGGIFDEDAETEAEVLEEALHGWRLW